MTINDKLGERWLGWFEPTQPSFAQFKNKEKPPNTSSDKINSKGDKTKRKNNFKAEERSDTGQSGFKSACTSNAQTGLKSMTEVAMPDRRCTPAKKRKEKHVEGTAYKQTL